MGNSDTGSFGSLQALPSFVNRFGTLNGSGKYILETSHKSMMNSLPWIGKLTGCLSAEPVIERLGYKKAMYISAAIQLIAVTSKRMSAIKLHTMTEAFLTLDYHS